MAELVGEYVHQMNRQLLFELDTSVCETTKIQAIETVLSSGQKV